MLTKRSCISSKGSPAVIEPLVSWIQTNRFDFGFIHCPVTDGTDWMSEQWDKLGDDGRFIGL